MQWSDAWESTPHQVCLRSLKQCEQSSELRMAHPSKGNTSPVVNIPYLLQSRPRSRRRRRKRVWRAAWTYLLQGASFLAHVRLAAVDDADDKGDYDGNCCQTSY